MNNTARARVGEQIKDYPRLRGKMVILAKQRLSPDRDMEIDRDLGIECKLGHGR